MAVKRKADAPVVSQKSPKKTKAATEVPEKQPVEKIVEETVDVSEQEKEDIVEASREEVSVEKKKKTHKKKSHYERTKFFAKSIERILAKCDHVIKEADVMSTLSELFLMHVEFQANKISQLTDMNDTSSLNEHTVRMFNLSLLSPEVYKACDLYSKKTLKAYDAHVVEAQKIVDEQKTAEVQ